MRDLVHKIQSCLQTVFCQYLGIYLLIDKKYQPSKTVWRLDTNNSKVHHKISAEMSAAC